VLTGLLVVAVTCTGCATAFNGSPGNITGTKASLFGFVYSTTGGDVEFWVEYGLTDSYGSASAHSTALTQANERRSVFASLAGLQRSTTYHYRFCAQDSQQSGGPGCGADGTFTTANLECGDTITHDFTLSRSMFCESFSAPGLVVGEDGIDINLAGRSFSGPLQIFFDSPTPTGIDNTAGHDDVTIRNGRLDRWGQSISLERASFNTIRGISTSPTGAAVRIQGGEANTIRSSELTGSRLGAGVASSGSADLVVADSSGRSWRLDGPRARILRNVVEQGFGDFGVCLYVAGNGSRVESNTVAGCPGGGLVIGPGGNATVLGNEASGSATGTAGEPDGIRVEVFTAGVLLQNNNAHDNADDGIDVRATATRLQGNRADDNGDFGIDAVAGVSDLGGNTASGNGNPLQCRNVFCE
jgi:parallel beta-helix repeat protein